MNNKSKTFPLYNAKHRRERKVPNNNIMKEIKIMSLKEVNKKIEDAVVGGYKKIEEGVVGGYKKVEDKFVDKFLTKDGETVEEAKERIQAEQKDREDKMKADMAERKAKQDAMIQASIDASKNAGPKF